MNSDRYVSLPLGLHGVHRAGPFTPADDVVLARAGELPPRGGLVVTRDCERYALARLGCVAADGVELFPLEPGAPVLRLPRDGVVGAVVLRWCAEG